MTQPLLEIRDLSMTFNVKSGAFGQTRGTVRALHGINLTIGAGEALGIAGESGSGKTTLARILVGLQKPTSGKILLHGEEIPQGVWPLELRRKVQMVFQDASGFLNPRQTIRQAVMEALASFHPMPKDAMNREIDNLLETVGLSKSLSERLPHELSGGQRQRVAIAKALATKPELIVLDEPTSALDVSVQAQILNLLERLRQETGMSYLLISHDLNVISHLCDEVGIMYLGGMAEKGPVERVFPSPAHPYTKVLLSAIPDPDPNAPWEPVVLDGDIPSAMNPPGGCVFHPRCPVAIDRCRSQVPAFQSAGGGVEAACHLLDERNP